MLRTFADCDPAFESSTAEAGRQFLLFCADMHLDAEGLEHKFEAMDSFQHAMEALADAAGRANGKWFLWIVQIDEFQSSIKHTTAVVSGPPPHFHFPPCVGLSSPLLSHNFEWMMAGSGRSHVELLA